MSNTRVLVTGATGFLGANILRAFAEDAPHHTLIAACRQPENLPSWYTGEVRSGDLRDPHYRSSLVKNVEVVCHAGTWGALWGHEQFEREAFYAPAMGLIDECIAAGVARFLMAGTVVISQPRRDGSPVHDSAAAVPTGFWPHLDYLVDIENSMRQRSEQGTQMVSMRLGHFVGRGNTLGIVPALIPRLKTGLVPWLAGGNGRVPLISGGDLGRAFVAAGIAEASTLAPYQAFNFCDEALPTSREFFNFLCALSGTRRPMVSVSYWMGYAFAWLMEKTFPIVPGKAPFLTRSIIHLAEDWNCSTALAQEVLGFRARDDWRVVAAEAVEEIMRGGAQWQPLAQPRSAVAEH